MQISSSFVKLVALKSGDFREAWADYYGESLSMRDILSVLEKVRSLLKAKR